MAASLCRSVLFAVVTGAVGASATEGRGQAAVTPIAKVLQLLDNLATKGRAEKETEATKFAAFSQWCNNQKRTKNNEIQVASDSIEGLKASIETAESDIRQLTARVEELDEDVGRWEKDRKSASEVRSKETEDFRATSRDYQESIDALTSAIAVLKKQAFDRPQAEAALMQVQRLPLLASGPKRALAAFLQQAQAQPDEEFLLRKGPEAHGYEFQSGGIVDLLANLKTEFSTKKYELDAEELNAQHAFEQIAQQLVDNVEGAKHEISKKTATKAETQQAKAQAEGELAQTTADRAEDQQYLAETSALCDIKQADFASRQKLRGEELVAIHKAIEIIGSQDVSGTGDKHLPALMQIRRAASALVQLRGQQQSPAQARLAAFLAGRAQSCGSRQLSMLAEQVATGPFDKVKKLIQNLIFKLMEEATSETEHKGWCDSELATNKNTREAKTDSVNELQAEVEGLTSDITELAQSIATLSAELAELDSAMAAATAVRSANKATNEQTIKDAEDAQVAVGKAIAVLKDFYAAAAQTTALAQQDQSPAEDAPETFDKPYKGMGAEGGGVVDFLEVILSDFTRLESDTTASEATEVSEYKKYMFESEKDKALKENEKGHKESSKTDKESALHSAQLELKTTQDQLDAANAYYEKLKPTCLDSGISYEDRVKRREEEVQSLKEALEILKGTAIA